MSNHLSRKEQMEGDFWQLEGGSEFRATQMFQIGKVADSWWLFGLRLG